MKHTYPIAYGEGGYTDIPTASLLADTSNPKDTSAMGVYTGDSTYETNLTKKTLV